MDPKENKDPFVKEIVEKGHLMGRDQSIAYSADIAIDTYVTDCIRKWVCVYGIRWKGSSTYIYVGLTTCPELRLEDHRWKFCPRGRFFPKRCIDMDILLEFEERPYLVYEYEHRFSLEYLRLGYPLQIKEFYTDQTKPDYNYLTASLDDPHLKNLFSGPETANKYGNWHYPFGYHPTYHELYTSIREKTGTTHYQPVIPEPRLLKD